MSQQQPYGGFDPKTIKILWWLLIAACVLPLLGEFFVEHGGDHGIHGFFPQWPVVIPFYPVLGFLACAASILLAKGLGVLLKKGEDYYDHD